MEYLINPDSRKPLTKAIKMYIGKLLKKGKIEFQQWNGGLRSQWSASYPKQDLRFNFGNTWVSVRFQNSPHRIDKGHNGNFAQILLLEKQQNSYPNR